VDKDISAFIWIKYLGSILIGGVPAHDDECVEISDNLGFILGMSSSLFNEVCSPFPTNNMNSIDTINLLTPIMNKLGYVPTSTIKMLCV
jgi:lysophospholipase